MDAAPNAPSRELNASTILGHPRGLFFLAFTEAWERFSFYGMTALVVLYMVNQLLLPGHVEHIVGFAAFRASVESIVGPLSTQAFASQIFGLYSGFVYFTPLLGGMIADRWIGQRNAVVIGALSMSAGHLAMAFEQSFLLALTLLVIGSGFLKGNISAQVGALYPPDDDARRVRGFSIFSMGINIGATIGPLICGWLAQRYGWDVGFGAAGVFMIAGLITYLIGYRYLPARVAKRSSAVSTKQALTAQEWRVIRALIVVVIITVFQGVAYYQCYNDFPVFAQDHVNTQIGSLQFPIPWFQSLDPFFSIIGVPLLFALWRYQSARGAEPGDLRKIGTGAWICAASNLILLGAYLMADGRQMNAFWPVLYFAGLGIAFLYYWPTLLALVSRAAPAAVNATMMGIAFLSLFVGNNLVGWVGGFYEPLGPVKFWLLHAGISAVGGLLVLLLGKWLSRELSATP